ncbi:hypothetical protein ACYBSK_00705 [Streptomyces sp. BYX5S]
MGTDPSGPDDALVNAVDERERRADERERRADEREHTADERERMADERAEQLAVWEKRLDRLAHRIGLPTSNPRDRSYQAINRARALVDASQARLDRSEAALRRADERDDREQRTIDGEVESSRQRETRHGPTKRESLEARALRLWQQRASNTAYLRTTHEALAHEYARLARVHPEQAEAFQRRADHARQVAAELIDPDPGQ